MATVSIDEAQTQRPELLEKLGPGEEVVITKDSLPIGRLVGIAEPQKRKLGTLRGTVTYMAPDFDAAVDDFKD